jgi:hypothetical protein
VTRAVGKRVWVVAGGHVPLVSRGPEPAFTSHDRLAILNAGGRPARVELTLYYADAEPVGPYCIDVAPRRVRKVRLNELIDPFAMPLGEPYGAVIRSDRPIVVQFSRLDSGTDAAITGTVAFG